MENYWQGKRCSSRPSNYQQTRTSKQARDGLKDFTHETLEFFLLSRTMKYWMKLDEMIYFRVYFISYLIWVNNLPLKQHKDSSTQFEKIFKKELFYVEIDKVKERN